MAKLLIHRASNNSFSRRALLQPTLLNPFSLPRSSPSPCAARLSFTAASATLTVGTRPYRKSRGGFSSLWPNYRSRIVHSHARVLLWIMVQRDWDADLEQKLGHSGIPLKPNVVDQVIACIPSAKLALQFFIWAGEQIGYPPIISKAACSVAQHYTTKSQVSSFLKCLKGLEDPRFGLSPPRVNVLLQGYGWAGMLDRAFALMLKTNSFSNDILVKCFLQSIMREHRYDMVYDVYIEMKKLGTPLGLCYSELIQGMALAGVKRWNEADLLFKQMVESGHALRKETCNALILSICRAGQHERAVSLLEHMQKVKIRLTNTTYDAVIECLCHTKQLHTALIVIDEMKRHGYVPSPRVYKSFLEALGDEGGLEKQMSG